MGKVGSQSITYALHKKGIIAQHVHCLSNDTLKSEFPTKNNDIVYNLKNNKKKYNVIVFVRDPMARNLSAFFQRIRKWTSKKPEHMSAREIQKDFIKNYDITLSDQWFKRELFTFFDLDIYKYKFPKEDGYRIYNSGKHKILIMKLEFAKYKLAKALKEFLNISDILMEKKGAYMDRKVGKDFIKKYQDIKSMSFPDSFVEKNYNLNYSKHFYSKKEIEMFKLKWKPSINIGLNN